jgi:gliding motility-associated-like protein
MWIFDRWGKQLFYSKYPERPWEGTVDGTPVQIGVYNYKFIIQDITNRAKTYSGNVTMYR